MPAMTEDLLQGEWFYLEGDEPLDRINAKYYALHRGDVRWNASCEIIGRYVIEDGIALVTFARTIPFTVTITLQSSEGDDADRGDWLNANTVYTMPDGADPHQVHGSFVRRIADFLGDDDVRKRSG